MNAIRDNYKKINSSIEYLEKESKDHDKRIEKLEGEAIILHN